MGCFDVSCGISGMTIKHGDDAVLLLIVPASSYTRSIHQQERDVKIEQGLQQVHSEGPFGLL